MGLVNLVPANAGQEWNKSCRTTHWVPNSKKLVFFELRLEPSSQREMDTGAGGKEHGWSYAVRDSQEFQVDCLRITWSQSLVHRQSCFEHGRARYVIQMV